MVSPWGFLAGGLLSGVGAGMAEDGKAMRERALKELEHQWAGELVDKRIGAQMEEGRLDREFKASEGDKTRTVTVDENAKDRAARENLALAEKPSDAALKAAQANYYRTLAAQAGIKSDEVQSVQTASDGSLHIVTKSGKVVPTGITGDNKEPLVEVYDPNSPTGTRMVRRRDAEGQPGKPESGMELTHNPDGSISFKTGRKGAAAGDGTPTPTTLNKVQGGILDDSAAIDRLNEIRKNFDPKFQVIGDRIGYAWSGWKEKFGEALPETERAELAKFTRYMTSAAENFSRTLKDISGGAVTPQEFERTSRWLPNPGTGLWDGDSPTAIQAKMDHLIDFGKRAVAKKLYIQKNGMKPGEVDIDSMPEIMQKRGGEIANELGASMSGDQLKRAVRDRLSDEFGLGTLK